LLFLINFMPDGIDSISLIRPKTFSEGLTNTASTSAHTNISAADFCR
jgi:hypothetical protein